MTVKELITKLLDMDMNAPIMLTEVGADREESVVLGSDIKTVKYNTDYIGDRDIHAIDYEIVDAQRDNVGHGRFCNVITIEKRAENIKETT